MTSLVPIAKALYLCDEVLSDSLRVKPHLIGLLNAVRPPAYPHTVPQLCVFARLIGGLGDVRVRVLVVNAQDRSVVYQSADQVIRFAERHQSRYFIMRMKQILCPAPGEYWVELYCNDEFIDDAVLRLEPSEASHGGHQPAG